jgi:hypothetical protein
LGELVAGKYWEMFTLSKTRKDDQKIREDKFVECNYGILAYEPQGLWLDKVLRNILTK